MIDIQIKPQIKAIKLIIFHKRDKSIAQGGYLDTCRDYRLPSLNFGKKPKCSGIYLGNIQKSIAKASKSVSTRFLRHVKSVLDQRLGFETKSVRIFS